MVRHSILELEISYDKYKDKRGKKARNLREIIELYEFWNDKIEIFERADNLALREKDNHGLR